MKATLSTGGELREYILRCKFGQELNKTFKKEPFSYFQPADKNQIFVSKQSSVWLRSMLTPHKLAATLDCTCTAIQHLTMRGPHSQLPQLRGFI